MHHLECFQADDATLESDTLPIDSLTFYFQYVLVPDRNLDTDAPILSTDDFEPVCALPVVLAGDFNADAENSSDPTYQLLLSGGFFDAWSQISPNEPGLTWPLFLENPFVYTTPTQRLDLVFTRGAVTAEKADLVGEHDVTPQLPMPSDHAGVVVTLKLQ